MHETAHHPRRSYFNVRISIAQTGTYYLVCHSCTYLRVQTYVCILSRYLEGFWSHSQGIIILTMWHALVSQGWAYLVTILRNILKKSMPPRKKTLPCGAGPPLHPPIPSGEKHTETVKLEPVAGRLLCDPGNRICQDKIKLSLFTALDTRGLLQAALVANGW